MNRAMKGFCRWLGIVVLITLGILAVTLLITDFPMRGRKVVVQPFEALLGWWMARRGMDGLIDVILPEAKS